jgi:two-component system chemotaxis response regulator CheY
MTVDSKKVLVVDDSTTMRRMVSATLLTLKEVQCLEARNGLDAIERLALEKVDLIVLDLNMPDMHGLEVVRFVRKHAAFNGIPIIVLTTRNDEISRETLLAAGASSFLNKPFDPAVLMEHARRQLNLL